MYKVIFVLSVLFLGSCSVEQRAQRHLKRAEKLNPYIFDYSDVTIIDTIIVKDTIYNTSNTLIQGDTIVVINDNKTTLKYYVDSSKAIHHYLNVKGDTIIKEIKVPIKTIEIKEQHNFLIYLLFALICFLVLYIFFKK